MDPSVSKIIVHITLMTTSGILSLLADQPSSNIHYLLIPIWLHPTQCKNIFHVNSYKGLQLVLFCSGSNRHLDLDGILFLGGVRTTMYSNLPREIISKQGYQVLNQDKVLLVCCVETIDCFCRDALQTWMLVVTLHILSKMLWCLPNMF